MNAKRTEPSVSLLQGKKYVPALHTNLAEQWRQFHDYAKRPPNRLDYAKDEADANQTPQMPD